MIDKNRQREKHSREISSAASADYIYKEDFLFQSSIPYQPAKTNFLNTHSLRQDPVQGFQ